MKLVGQAVKEWDMIKEGYNANLNFPLHTCIYSSSSSICSMQIRDRLLLGLSGGKDSLAMLHALVALQKRAPVRYFLLDRSACNSNWFFFLVMLG